MQALLFRGDALADNKQQNNLLERELVKEQDAEQLLIPMTRPNCR